MRLSRVGRLALAVFAAQACLILVWLSRYTSLFGGNQGDDTPKVLRVARPPGSKYKFDVNQDVLVFYHIQKTGGTAFNTHLVENLALSEPCSCSTTPPDEGACRCRDAEGYTWLYSRFTTSSTCGVHPPLRDLSRCAQLFLQGADAYPEGYSRRFLYMTVLRHPVDRYLSEWHHVRHVGQWPLTCHHGNQATPTEVVWRNMTLDVFIAVRYNPASNRQVRMLGAKYGESACVDHENSLASRQEALNRAKESLKELEYFALLEYPEESQRLLRDTFGIRMLQNLTFPRQESNGRKLQRTLHPGTLERIRELNQLDIKLYDYAKELFFHRLRESSN